MAGVPLSAKNACVRINTINICYAQKWDVRPSVEEQDVSNFEGQGAADRIPGLEDCEYTVEGWWDSAGNNYDSPLNIRVGVSLANVYLHVAGAASPAWFFSKSLITETPHTADVHGLHTFKFTAKGQGIPLSGTYLTGNV